MSLKRVLLTGITGALGPWLAAELLEAGHSVTAIARAPTDQSAQQRAAAAISRTGRAISLKRLIAVSASLADLPSLPGAFDLVVHCAACTAFDAASAADSRETNINGLRSVLKLAQRERAAVVHVSTAYVCGERAGCVREAETFGGQSFNNTYEATKCIGEEMAVDWAGRSRLPLTVLRPGIVLGAWDSGRAIRFNTLYHLMAALDHARPTGSASRTLRLIGHPDVTKNIIPVDYFAGIAKQLIDRKSTGTFHLTHPRPITMGQLRGIFNELFDVQIEYVSREQFESARTTPLERLCARVMRPYQPYMSVAEPAFDQSRLLTALGGAMAEPPILDLPYFQRLLAFGRQCRWSGAAPTDAVDRDGDDQTIADYFGVFLTARIGLALLPSLKRTSARFCIVIEDQPDQHWTLTLQDGVLTRIAQAAESGDCKYSLSARTFLSIAAAELSPQKAFFAGRVKIAGDMETGLKIATLLGKFFVDHPYLAEATCA